MREPRGNCRKVRLSGKSAQYNRNKSRRDSGVFADSLVPRFDEAKR
jgi:hypothetical protein